MNDYIDRHPSARRSQIEMQIADGVWADEKRNAKMLGHDKMSVAFMSFGAFCEVWSLSLAEDRPAVWPRGSEPRDIS